jgi:glycosyltransferase involved in cell wall biosynthesis
MRIWLITIGEPLPIDHGNERLHRAGILAEMLATAGHDVVWWTSTFNHSTKEFRASESATIEVAPNYRIRMLHGGGYRRNVSLARLRDHRRIAREFAATAQREAPPDVIVTSLPALELSEAAATYGRTVGVPVIVDVRDLWPDVFADVFPRALQPFTPIALAPLRRIARAACRDAYAIWGHAPAFVEWGLRHAGRQAREFDLSFPFGYVTTQPGAAEIDVAMATWAGLGVTPDFDGITACFIGAVGHQTDVVGIVQAARELRTTPGVRFVICGSGDRLASVRADAAGLSNVVFAGWRRRVEIWTLLQLADIGIAPYANRADFRATIPNKVPEYLSGGLPVAVNLSSGVVYDLLGEHECGFSYHEDPRELAAWLVRLRDDRQRLATMSRNARALFEQQFRADTVYQGMIDALQSIVDRHAQSSLAGAHG